MTCIVVPLPASPAFIGDGSSSFVNLPIILIFIAVKLPVSLAFIGVSSSNHVNPLIAPTFVVRNLPVFLTFISVGSSRYVNPSLRATPVALLFFAHLGFSVEVLPSGIVNLLVFLMFIVVHLPASLKFVGDCLSTCVNPFS